MRWRLNPLCQLHWRCWDDEYILFNASSGQTHFLSVLGALTLQLVADRALDREQLLTAFSDRLDDFTVDAETQEYVANMLADLDNLGLIEPVP